MARTLFILLFWVAFGNWAVGQELMVATDTTSGAFKNGSLTVTVDSFSNSTSVKVWLKASNKMAVFVPQKEGFTFSPNGWLHLDSATIVEFTVTCQPDISSFNSFAFAPQNDGSFSVGLPLIWDGGVFNLTVKGKWTKFDDFEKAFSEKYKRKEGGSILSLLLAALLALAVIGLLFLYSKLANLKKNSAGQLQKAVENNAGSQERLVHEIWAALNNDGHLEHNSKNIQAIFQDIKTYAKKQPQNAVPPDIAKELTILTNEKNKLESIIFTANSAQKPAQLPNELRPVFERFLADNADNMTTVKQLIEKLKHPLKDTLAFPDLLKPENYTGLENEEVDFLKFMGDKFKVWEQGIKSQLTDNQQEKAVFEKYKSAFGEAMAVLGKGKNTPPDELPDLIKSALQPIDAGTKKEGDISFNKKVQELYAALSDLKNDIGEIEDGIKENSPFKAKINALLEGGNGVRGLQSILTQLKKTAGKTLHPSNFFEETFTDEFREFILELAKSGSYATLPKVAETMRGDGLNAGKISEVWRSLKKILAGTGLEIKDFRLGKDRFEPAMEADLDAMTTGGELSVMQANRFDGVISEMPTGTIYDFEQLGFSSEKFKVPENFKRARIIYKNW